MKNLIFALMFVAVQSVALDSGSPFKEIFEPKAPAEPGKFGKVAVIQWSPSKPTPLGVSESVAEAYKQGNRDDLADYIREAARKGAKLIVTPEFAVVGFPERVDFESREDVRPFVETVPGKTTQYFGALAKELGVYIHIGFAEKDMKTDEYFNAVAVLGPDGLLVKKHRKINLFRKEVDFLSPGTKPSTYENAFFGKIAIAICADIFLGDLLGYYYEKRVVAVALSVSWAGYGGMNAFKNVAYDVDTYVLASNNAYYPDAGVINPDGTTQSHLWKSSGVAYGYLPLK